MNTDKQLTVKVMSFSYRKGIPEDTSGNGEGTFSTAGMYTIREDMTNTNL